MSVLQFFLVTILVGCAAAVHQHHAPPPRRSTMYSGHECGNHDDDKPTTNRSVKRSFFRPQSTSTSGDPYTGRGVILGNYWASFPFIRTYRLVLASYKSYADMYTIVQNAAERIEKMNALYERDFGVHLVLVDVPLADEDIFDGLTSSTRFIKQEVGYNNFEMGLYLRAHAHDGGYCATGGIYLDNTKGHCTGYWGLSVVAHELGHLLGARHPHAGLTKMEPYKGYSVMSHGDPRKVFNLGSALEINTMFLKYNKSKAFSLINNSNTRPQINVQKSRLRPQWKIPHSTAFRFKIDANDPDEDDQLMYYVQQMNFEEADQRNPDYRDQLLGDAYFINEEVTADRNFYFCTRYQYLKRMGYIVKDTAMTQRDTYTYDMFVNVFDSNEAKRQKFVSSYDAIVKQYTTELIKNRDDLVRSAELNTEMRSRLSAYTNKNESWLPKRDTYHVQVIALKNQTPFSVSISPARSMLYSDEDVTLTWEYDSATISDGDHVTIRFSNDGLVSFPYVMKRSILAREKTATFRVPAIPTEKGFFIVEHDEGIVFAHTKLGTNQYDTSGKEGAFTIKARDVRTRIPKLTPPGPVIVKDLASLKAFLAKVTSSVHSVKYVLADEDGAVLGVYSELSSNAGAIMQLLEQKKGTYCKLVAVTGAQPSTDANVVDLQANGYRADAAQFVSNAVEIKLYSKDAVRFIPEDESWAVDLPAEGQPNEGEGGQPNEGEGGQPNEGEGGQPNEGEGEQPSNQTTNAETKGQTTKGNGTEYQYPLHGNGIYSQNSLSLLFSILVFLLL